MAVVPDLGYCDTLGRPLNFDAGSVEGFPYLEGTTQPAASSDVAVSGSYSLKCTVPAGTSNGRSQGEYGNATNTAAEYFADGDEVWFGFQMYVADASAEASYQYLANWTHDGAGGDCGIYFGLVPSTTNLRLVYNGGAAATASLGGILFDDWDHWVFNIKFSQTNTVGYINAWRNGTQVITNLQPSNGTFDETQGVDMLWRAGIIRSSSLTSLQTVYFDDIAVATTRAGVEELADDATVTPSAVATQASVYGTASVPNAVFKTLTDSLGLADAGAAVAAEETVTDDAGGADSLTAVYPPWTPPESASELAALDEGWTLGGGIRWLYGLQESSGSTVAGDVSAAPGRPRLALTSATYGSAEFGAAGIMPEGTAIRFAPALSGVEGDATVYGWTLGSSSVVAYLGSEWTLFAQFAWSGGSGVRLLRVGSASLGVTISASPTQVTAALVGATGSRSVSVTAATGDNQPHMVVLTCSATSLTLTVDGAQIPAATAQGLLGTVTGLTIGGAVSLDEHQVAWVGYSSAAMTAAAALDLANLGSRGAERSDLRVARICRWVGVDSDLAAEEGLSDVAYQAAGGNQPLDLIAAVNEVEDGTFYPAGDGRLVQQSRSHRYDAPVRLVLSAEQVSADLAVKVDLARVVNDYTVSRPAGATYRVRNEASIAAYGPRSASATLYAATDDDLALAAQWRVNRYAAIRPRIPEVTVNLLPLDETTAAAVLSLEVGDRFQVTGMPSTTPGGTTVDLFVEGVAETVAATAWAVTFATSPYRADIFRLDDDALLDTATLAY